MAVDSHQEDAGLSVLAAECRGIDHVGVVFVHGIGAQAPGETLLAWSAPMVRFLQTWRLRRGLSGDVVTQSQLNPSAGTLFVELEIPAWRTLPKAHWLLTEAAWAPRVTAPSFAEVFAWLGPRGGTARIAALLNRSASTLVIADSVGDAVVSAFASMGLAAYGVLRTATRVLPAALRDQILVAAADKFLLEWFGDVFVLLEDEAQAKAISRHVGATVDFLAENANSIVLLAHSGGAIVSRHYLGSSKGSNEERIRDLVTFGQGLNLAWEMIGSYRSAPTGAVTYPDLRRQYPQLFPDSPQPRVEWMDIFATHDPAPNGPLLPPAGANVGLIREFEVVNRMSIAEDHGSYWENDEEFVPLVMSAIDSSAVSSRRESSRHTRFWQGPRARRYLAESREQRVRVGALWNRLVVRVATGTLLVVTFGDFGQSRLLLATGETAGGLLTAVPGLSVIADLIGKAQVAFVLTFPELYFPLALAGTLILLSVLGLWALFLVLSPGPPWRTVEHYPVGPRRNWGMVGGLALDQASRLLLALPVAYALILVATVLLRAVGGDNASALPLPRDALSGAVVGLVAGFLGMFVLPAALRGLAGRIGSPARSSRWTVVFSALALMLGLALVGIAAVSIILTPYVGARLLGGLTILLAFWAVGRVGRWRWNSWDERERAARRLGSRLVIPRTAAVWYSLLLVVALVTIACGLVARSLAILSAGAAVVGLTAVAGMAGDSLRVQPARSKWPPRT